MHVTELHPRSWSLVVLALSALVGCGAGEATGRGAAIGERPGDSGAPTPDPGAPVQPSGDDPVMSDVDFDNAAGAPAPPPTGVEPGAAGCRPGHYVGTFHGEYRSAAWGNGTLPIAIAATDVDGRPGFEFWLEESESECTDAEFCPDLEVKGGKLRGFADTLADPAAPPDPAAPALIAIRFEIDFGGELDCASGQFRGRLENGCYDLATILFRFEGPATAVFDDTDNAFEMGEWDVTEQEMPDLAIIPPDANIGGEGTWSATLVDSAPSPLTPGTGLCD